MPTCDKTLVCQTSGERIDRFLAVEEPSLSRMAIQRLIGEGRVTVNGLHSVKNHRLKEGDVVCISIPESKAYHVLPQDIPLEWVYEDEHLIVINKEKGMVVHPAPGNRDRTLVNALMHHCRDSLSDIGGMERPGIVHRIDKDTSGLLVAAKTNTAHQVLSQMLSRHLILREYATVVHGVIQEDSALIDAPIGRHAGDRKKMAVDPRQGKRAVTRITVIRRFHDATYVSAVLETGRTHQIRVHLSHIRHPVLGDAMYGPKPSWPGLSGQALHAWKLAFSHPVTGVPMEFSAPLPPYFQALLEDLAHG